MMEQEIDLRPYFRAIVQAWKPILSMMLIAALGAAIFSYFMPRPSMANAQLLVLPTASQVSLDPRFTTRETTVTNAGMQRQALIDLASSPVMEARAAQELGLTGSRPGALLGKVEVSATSDLLTFTVSDDDALAATRLAEVWARSYEALVNELYTGVEAQAQRIDGEMGDALSRYEEAQRSLEAFLTQGETVSVDQEVQRLEGLLAVSREAQQLLYANHLTRTQELSLLIDDARTVRAQINTGSPFADTLADLALRSRAAGGVPLPLSLRFESPDAFTQGRAVTANDLDQLISVLERERDRFVSQAAELSSAIAAGESSSVGLEQATRARYEQELATASSRLEGLKSRETLLTARRDLALESLKVLQAKSAELALAKAVPTVNVRFIGSSAIAPSSAAVSTVVAVILATALAFGLSVLVVIAMELMRRIRPGSDVPTSSPGERPVDQPVASR